MNLDWLKDRTIFLTLHGSQAYGLANELSDIDVKGVCVPPRKTVQHLFHRFEQAENSAMIEENYAHWKNPKNPKFESVVYSLKKFFTLASNVNPNIIELLWTDSSTWLEYSKWSQRLIERRGDFLSTKAKFTFAGYAVSQLKKIERHRKWIVQGELVLPKREDFGLPSIIPNGVEEVFSYIKARVEEMNLNQFSIPEDERAEIKELIWDIIYQVSNKVVDWDNWPDAYAAAVIKQMQTELSLKDEVVALINAERAYFKAANNYKSWLKWKAERNPARRELEIKSGFDTKHASHLVRLLRCGIEIITTGEVVVKRPDAEELLLIKNGGWSYEKVMSHAEELQKNLDQVYRQMEDDRKAGKPVILPKSVNYDKLNDFYYELSEAYYAEMKE